MSIVMPQEELCQSVISDIYSRPKVRFRRGDKYPEIPVWRCRQCKGYIDYSIFLFRQIL